MPKIYDKNDLFWTFQSDLFISDGDIADTNHDPLRSLYQEIRTRLQSEIGDWTLYPSIGATLRDFIGKANNKMTAEALKSRIIVSLTQDGLINQEDLNIVYAPIDHDKIMIRLSLKVAATPKNRGAATLSINFIYNYTENNILFH